MGVTERPLGGYPVGKNAVGFKKAGTVRVEPSTFPAVGTYIFTPTVAGYWKLVAWGAGGAGSSGVSAGASGAYGEITKYLTSKTPVTIVVGQSDTTLTFSDGHVATAGAASLAVAGVATGFDVNLPGTAGVLTGNNNGNPGLGTGGGLGAPASGGTSGGAGAPANLPYRGSPGGTRTGIGGGESENAGISSISLGHAIAAFIKP